MLDAAGSPAKVNVDGNYVKWKVRRARADRFKFMTRVLFLKHVETVFSKNWFIINNTRCSVTTLPSMFPMAPVCLRPWLGALAGGSQDMRTLNLSGLRMLSSGG